MHLTENTPGKTMDHNWYYCNSCNRWWQGLDGHTHYTQIKPIEYKRMECPECLIVQPEVPVASKSATKTENKPESPPEKKFIKEAACTTNLKTEAVKQDEISRLKEINKFLYKSIQEKNIQIGMLNSKLTACQLRYNELQPSDKELLEQQKTPEPTNNEIIKTLIKEYSIFINNIIMLLPQITENEGGTHERKKG